MQLKTLAIVGAGAKAAAIVARAAVLRDLGVANVPNILVFEAKHVGAAWSGAAGFSNGHLRLCTPGEKDVGFPYDETAAHGSATSPVAHALFARFSWSSYLVATGRLSDWVDRGRSPPTHQGWARYLAWVFETADQKVVKARVTSLSAAREGWKISFASESGPATALADGVVVTGTGKAKTIPCAAGMPPDRVFDAETFWPPPATLLALEEGTVAVAGDGGAAGTIIAWLVEHFAERPVAILNISPAGTLFPRGDGYAERRWFSDPSDWRLLSPEHRRKILERTEAGVVSARNKALIDCSPSVGYRWGKALEARWNGDEIEVAIEYDGHDAPPQMTDYLVGAIGFDSWSLLESVDHPSVTALLAENGASLRREVEAAILADLSLPALAGLPTGLHVPALAGLARGPGMGNLGCLGLMAASLLQHYISN